MNKIDPVFSDAKRDSSLSETPFESAEKNSASKTYTAGTGTLRYSLRGLFVLFLWLLCGDFAFTFFESIFSRFIPLYLKDLNASNSLVGVMTGSIAGLVNIFFLPNISQWSDDYRSRLGRRIPFLYVVTPLTVISLIAVGFTPEIAGWLHSQLISRVAPSIAVATIILPLLCGLVVSYHCFNMVLVNAYNWLLRDVVPLEFMGRFLSWFRIINNASLCLFLWYVFPQIIAHRREVCLGVGIFYLISFLLMCYNVKEGEYPPPPLVADRPGILKSFVLYFRDCLSVPIYRNFFIAYVLAMAASSCAGSFALLFARDTLGLSMDDMGKIFAWTAGAVAVTYLPMGWLCDKFSPLSVAPVALFGQVIGTICAYFWVTDKESFLICNLVFTVPAVGWGLGSLATTMRLFPEEKFGQFSSGINVFGCGILIPGNYLVGKFMDIVHSDYRMIYVWSGLFFALALFPMILVYREWKQRGGPHHYIPPCMETPLA